METKPSGMCGKSQHMSINYNFQSKVNKIRDYLAPDCTEERLPNPNPHIQEMKKKENEKYVKELNCT